MSRAHQRKHHIVYQITRDDGKFYIGMHSTDNLEDGYFGSGQALWHSIRKHGKEKHRFEILKTFQTRKEACEYERLLVDENMVADRNSLNLRLGGSYVYRKPDKEEASANKSMAIRAFYASPESEAARAKISAAHKDRKHTTEARKNMGTAAANRIVKQKETGQWESIQEKNAKAHRGKKQSEETIRKRVASTVRYKEQNGGKRTFSAQACKNIGDAQRGNNKNAKTWVLTTPAGDEIIVKNLQAWLRENERVTTRTGDGIKIRGTKEILYKLELAVSDRK
jgi:hypothetical protein